MTRLPIIRLATAVLALSFMVVAHHSSVHDVYAAPDFRIEISNDLSGGDFYRTTTVDEAIYDRYTAGVMNDIRVPPAADLNRQPTKLSDLLHPVKGRSGTVGTLFTDSRPFLLSVREGYDSDVGGVLGRGTHNFNIGGTFTVVPGPGDPQTGSVKLLAKGMIDGFISVTTKGLAGPPNAFFGATIFIEHLGTVTATASSTGTQSETIGVQGNLNKEGPGVSGSAQNSVQVTTSSTSPVNFFMLGEVPINTPINWNFTMTLQAQNTENFLGGRSAAESKLVEQFVNLIAQGERHTFKSEFKSDSSFTFDAATGAVHVVHPVALVGTVEGVAILEDDGTPGPTLVTDFSGFMPEVEAILEDAEFSETDSLLHSLLRYSGIVLEQSNPDGTFSFTDGLLEFLDPFDTSNVLARASLTDILADPSADTFSGHISGFELVNLPPGSSPLASAFLSFPGEPGDIWFDPSIIFDSDFFADSGASSAPYSVDGSAPRPPVGGIVELSIDGSEAPASAAQGSGSSAPPYGPIAGGVAAALLALTAGGWYARRRWLR